jgi:stearoyl-CoA desaturase (delta-9 desaturase)
MLPKKPIHWINTLFLSGTLFLTLTAVPAYAIWVGFDAFQLGLFIFFTIATGMSITLGYHRLFSHLTFHASPLVKLFTLLFGAAAFEGSAMGWCADHRRHHKHVDEEEDPYDINKGFFHAHIGWLLFRHGPETPLTWVRDLQKDRMAAWQHRYYVPLAILMGFGLPTLLGFLVGGPMAALGAFLLAGVARTVVVHHMTFCINSLCHWIGDRPYSGTCSARDSFLMALFTFGEGYHNFHHEFQHDYRNGVRPWQFDPTKWTIWLLAKVGLVRSLRTVPEEKIIKARIAEQERRLSLRLEKHADNLPEALEAGLVKARTHLEHTLRNWEAHLAEYRKAMADRGDFSRRQLRQLRSDYDRAYCELRRAIEQWMATHRLIQDAIPVAV